MRTGRVVVFIVAAMMMLPVGAVLIPVAAQEVSTTEVRIVDFAFEPAEVHVSVGTIVTWTNAGHRKHTISADDGSFDSGRLDPGEQFSQIFDQPGTFTFHCAFHPEMKGTVVVEPGSTGSAEISPATGEQSPAMINDTVVESLLSTAQQDGLAATLHAGDCAHIGSEVAALEPAFVPTSARVGSARSLPGANSYSVVSVDIGAIFAADHSVVVAGADGATLACGDVGGFPTEAGSLVIGLRPEASTGLVGVAFLSPADSPNQTNISLFLTGDALQDGPVEHATTAQAQPDETPVGASEVSNQTNGDVATEMPTEIPVPTPTPVPLGSELANPAPLGTTLESQGLAVTVNTAYFDSGFGNAIPRGGYKVMILGVTIENVSDGNRGYDAARFGGIDAVTGNTYNPVTLEDVGVLLTNGDLQPGEYVSGTALIEVQETATDVVIKYDADILGDEDLYWS